VSFVPMQGSAMMYIPIESFLRGGYAAR